jgi:hypothetical protein
MSDQPTSEQRMPDWTIIRAADLIGKTPPPPDRRGERPIETARTPIEPTVSKMWWRGRQWAVTAYGIECVDPGRCYVIEAARLADRIDRYSWLEHMGCKTWVDTEEFATAWVVAPAMHGVKVSGIAVRKAVADAIVGYQRA